MCELHLYCLISAGFPQGCICIFPPDAEILLRGMVAARAREWYNNWLMHEQNDKLSNPRTGAIGAVLMYFLLGCALVVLFCWRVAATSRQETAPATAPQTE